MLLEIDEHSVPQPVISDRRKTANPDSMTTIVVGLRSMAASVLKLWIPGFLLRSAPE
jgi:hypothetical protein